MWRQRGQRSRAIGTDAKIYDLEMFPVKPFNKSLLVAEQCLIISYLLNSEVAPQ